MPSLPTSFSRGFLQSPAEVGWKMVEGMKTWLSLEKGAEGTLQQFNMLPYISSHFSHIFTCLYCLVSLILEQLWNQGHQSQFTDH